MRNCALVEGSMNLFASVIVLGNFKTTSPDGRVSPQCDAAELFLCLFHIREVSPENIGFLSSLDKCENTNVWLGKQIEHPRVTNGVPQGQHVC